jgi:predicted thioesterase
MMIRLMESIANDLIQPWLSAGLARVGCEVSVKHKAPALGGTKLTAKSKRLEADGGQALV